MDLGLKNRDIVVSGAANGIGSHIFHKLLKEQAFPIGIDIESFKGSELEGLIKNYDPVDYQFYKGNVANEEKMRSVIGNIKDVYGLVNNAGLLGDDKAHNGRTMTSWERLFEHNAKSAFVLTEILYPNMKEGSSIVNIGSIEVDMSAPNTVLYTASKASLLGLTVGYANELGPKMRVNMISPGNVNTKRNIKQYTDRPNIIKGFEGKTPLRRSVEPEEVADLALFLLSDKAKAITGENYRIDCGYTKALWDPSWDNIK